MFRAVVGQIAVVAHAQDSPLSGQQSRPFHVGLAGPPVPADFPNGNPPAQSAGGDQQERGQDERSADERISFIERVRDVGPKSRAQVKIAHGG